MTTPCPKRIIIVDDHPIVRDGYALLLGAEEDLEVCGYAPNETSALALIRAQQPDLAIVDLMLDGSHGIALVGEIRKQFPSVKVLVVSAHDEKLFAQRSLRAGATGFLNKREASDGLIESIRKALAGEVVLSPTMTRMVLQAQVGNAKPLGTTPVESLSDRELHVFQLIGQGLATRIIAEQLYLSPRTVERYRENIKAKLNLKSATELVQYATTWVLESGR